MLSVASNSDEDDTVAPRSDFGPVGATFGMDREGGLQVPGRIRTGTVEGKAGPAGGLAPISGLKASGNVEEDRPERLAAPTELIEPPSLTGALI